MQYHLTDAQGIYTRTVEIDPLAALPGPGTLDAPPATAGAQVAQWIGSQWRVLDERPAPPEPPPPPVPDSCTRRQGRLALLHAGKLQAVEQAISAIADPADRMAAQIEYEADTWERGNAFVQTMWEQLGGDAAGLDDMFRHAATL